jgi:hypothetical protein
MIPNIPDNFYKILFALGLFLIAYSFLQIQRDSQSTKDLSRKFDIVKDSLIMAGQDVDDQLQIVKDVSSKIAKDYKIPNQITTQDSMVTFHETFRGDKNKVLATKKIEIQWQKWILKQRKYNNYSKYKNKLLDQINEDITTNADDRDFWYKAAALGLFLTLAGVFGLMSYQTMQDKLLKKQITSGEKFKECQSCGKTFNANVQKAKFIDGEINQYYCSECFSNNTFADPNLDVKDVFLNYYLSIPHANNLEKLIVKSKVYNLHRWKRGRY